MNFTITDFVKRGILSRALEEERRAAEMYAKLISRDYPPQEWVFDMLDARRREAMAERLREMCDL